MTAHCLEREWSVQISKVDGTHVVLVSGKLVLQKGGSEHIPLKVPNIKFDFDVCVHMSKI